MPEKLTLKETAEMLGVSTATVLNWEKLGYIKSIREFNKPFYDQSEIELTKVKIENGSFGKLNARANKKKSLRTFLPDEYFENKAEIPLFEEIINIIRQTGLNIQESLFFLALNLLKSKDLINEIKTENGFDIHSLKSKNPVIIEELKVWADEIKITGNTSHGMELYKMKLPASGDILGAVYQSLLTEGHKSMEGCYYTPSSITREIVESCLATGSEAVKILDPCCGTGQFLLAAADFMIKNSEHPDPELIWGYDIDSVAVRIARINLYLKFYNYIFKPNLYVKNIIYQYTLGDLSGIERDFDLIIGNPPWGADLKFSQPGFLKDNYHVISSLESFSYFIYIGLELLKKEGKLSYILPESIINIRTHKDIRDYILKNAGIERIVCLGRVFRNVYTPVIRMDMVRVNDYKKELEVSVIGKSYSINQSRFKNNYEKIFDIYNTSKDQQIIDKVYSFPHTTLYNQADWVLGIVTGKNSLHLSEVKEDDYEPVYRGRDIEKYTFSQPSEFIRFDREKFQQAAAEEKYRVPEKLVYRFISNTIIIAYDNRQRLTLNSANIVIPRVADYPMKVILALFNSTLYKFIFQKKFFTHKVLRNHLEQLPLPLLDQRTFEEIIFLADQLINNNIQPPFKKKILDSIDDIFMNLFEFTAEEREMLYKCK